MKISGCSFASAFALISSLTLIPTSGLAQSLVPERGAVLKLVSAEDGNDFPKIASDVGLASAMIGSAMGASIFSYYAHKKNYGPYALSPLVDLGLAFAVNNLATFGLKHSLQRARPYAYSEVFQSGSPEIYSESERNDAYHSFPSGHTSNSAATTFALATSVALAMPNQSSKTAIVSSLYGLSTLLTGFVGYMRIRGGYHFYSDVFSGALLGALCGTLTPIVHHLLLPDDTPNMSVAAIPLSSSTQPLTFQLSGRF